MWGPAVRHYFSAVAISKWLNDDGCTLRTPSNQHNSRLLDSTVCCESRKKDATFTPSQLYSEVPKNVSFPCYLFSVSLVFVFSFSFQMGTIWTRREQIRLQMKEASTLLGENINAASTTEASVERSFLKICFEVHWLPWLLWLWVVFASLK